MFSTAQAAERQGRGVVFGMEGVCSVEECASHACCDGGFWSVVCGVLCFLLEAEVLCLAPEWHLTGEGEELSGEGDEEVFMYGVGDLVEV